MAVKDLTLIFNISKAKCNLPIIEKNVVYISNNLCLLKDNKCAKCMFKKTTCHEDD